MLHQPPLMARQPADQLLQLLRLLLPLLLIFLILKGDVMRGDQVAKLHATFISDDAIQAADRLHVHQQLLQHPIGNAKCIRQFMA